MKFNFVFRWPHDSASVHACAFFILVTGTSVDTCAIVGSFEKKGVIKSYFCDAFCI